MSWFVYIVQCADDTYYTGIAKDVKRRLTEHNGESNNLGAKYTRSRRPVSLVYSERADTRSDAASREFAIKKLSRKQKKKIIASIV